VNQWDALNSSLLLERIDAISDESIQYCPAVQLTTAGDPPHRKSASTSDKHRCITINVGSLDDDIAPPPPADPDTDASTTRVNITDVTLDKLDTRDSLVGSEEGLAVCGRYPSDQAVSADSTTSNGDQDVSVPIFRKSYIQCLKLTKPYSFN